MIRELSSDTQFVLITHNRTTMEVADVLYGITTQEPGVSTVVAVRLDPGRPLET
jgi:chromosome segregation protein